ncbi:MAG TPA: molybdenum cofactor biosynthesis protein B [Thiothrix sp.]|nr:molybdenum cofactor biosynthesis protein B [Thiothrix sp.]
MTTRDFIPLNIALATISDTRTKDNDTSGKTLLAQLTEAGHQCADQVIIPDDIYQIRATISAWMADPDIQAIITTGGTGITGRDGTPEAISPLLDKHIDGFGELFRALSYQEIGTSSLQSRAIAGVANRTFVFCLPGSTGACRTAWQQLIQAQLDNRTLPCNLVMLMPRLDER